MSISFNIFPYDSEKKILKCTFTPTKKSPHLTFVAFGCAGTTSKKQKKVAQGIKNLDPKPHFVLNIGDMIYSVGLNTHNVKLALLQFKDFLVEIYGECDAPFIFDLGNHEANFTNKAKGNTKYDLPFQLKGSQTKAEALAKLNAFVKIVELYNLGFTFKAPGKEEYKVETIEELPELLAFIRKHQLMESADIAKLETAVHQKNNELLNENEFDKNIAILKLLNEQLPQHLLTPLRNKHAASFHMPERYYLQRIVNTETNEVILIYHIDTNLLVIDEEQQNWLQQSYQEHSPTATRIIFLQHHLPGFSTDPRGLDTEDNKKYLLKDPGNLHREIWRIYKRLGISFLKSIFVAAHAHTASLGGNLWAASETMQDHLPQLQITTGNGGAEDNQKDFAFLSPGLIQSVTGAGFFKFELFSKGAVNTTYFSCDQIDLKSTEVTQPQKLFSVACDRQGKIIGELPPLNIHPSFFSPTKEKIKGSKEAIKQWSENLFRVLAIHDLSLLDIFVAGFADYQSDIRPNKLLNKIQIPAEKLQNLFIQRDIPSDITHSGQVNSSHALKEERENEKNKIILWHYLEKIENLLCEYLRDEPGFYTIFSAQLCILHLVLRMVYDAMYAGLNLENAISKTIERLGISIEAYEERLLREAQLPPATPSTSVTKTKVNDSAQGVGVPTPDERDLFDRQIPSSYDDDSGDEVIAQEVDHLLFVNLFETSFNEISIAPETISAPTSFELKSKDAFVRAVSLAINRYLQFTYPDEPAIYQRLAEFPDAAVCLLLLNVLPKVSSPLQWIAAFLKQCPDKLTFRNFKTIHTANLRRAILNALSHYRADIFSDTSFNIDTISQPQQPASVISEILKEEINERENAKYFDLLKKYFSKLASSDECKFYNDILNFNRVAKIAANAGICSQWLKSAGDDNPVLTKLIVYLTEMKKIIKEEGVQEEKNKPLCFCFWQRREPSLYEEHKMIIGKLSYHLSKHQAENWRELFDSPVPEGKGRFPEVYQQFLDLLFSEARNSKNLAEVLLDHPILKTQNWYIVYTPSQDRSEQRSELSRPLLT